MAPGLTNTTSLLHSSDIDRCQKLDLPPFRNRVRLFIDWETWTKVTTADEFGYGELATLHLDGLGAHYKIFRKFGGFSTVYVIDTVSAGGTSSRIEGNYGPGGAG